MRHSLAIVAGAGGLVVAAWLLDRSDGTDEPTVGGSESHTVTAISERAAVSQASDASSANRPVISTSSSGALSSSDLEKMFPLEERDRTWAEAAEVELNSRLSRATGLELVGLRTECRRRICRVEFTFPSTSYFRTRGATLVADALDGMSDFERGGSIVETGDGTQIYHLQRRAGIPSDVVR
jgi:hypothetical protein